MSLPEILKAEKVETSVTVPSIINTKRGEDNRPKVQWKRRDEHCWRLRLLQNIMRGHHWDKLMPFLTFLKLDILLWRILLSSLFGYWRGMGTPFHFSTGLELLLFLQARQPLV